MQKKQHESAKQRMYLQKRPRIRKSDWIHHGRIISAACESLCDENQAHNTGDYFMTAVSLVKHI